MEAMNDKLYEHPNFVWLDQLAIKEILEKRKPNNCEPVTILNNLLRWTLYQVRGCSSMYYGLGRDGFPYIL
jgi:hypothetical protein